MAKYNSIKDVDKMLTEILEKDNQNSVLPPVWSLREHLKKLKNEVPKVRMPKL